MKHKLIYPLLLALLGGCASLSEDQCRMGNWNDIGFADGMKGYTADRMLMHNEACVKYGISLNREQYLRGYEEGLKQYCIPSNAYEIGRSGNTYRNVCNCPESEDFLRLYLKGKRDYELEKRLSDIDESMKKIDGRLIHEKLGKDGRKELIRHRRDLEKERSHLLIEKGMNSRDNEILLSE